MSQVADVSLPDTLLLPDTNQSYVDRVASALGSIAHDIDDGRMSAGDQAALRRGWETGPGPALWRLAIYRLEPVGLARSVDEERRWAVIAAGLVETRGLPRGGLRFGQAAAEAGVAEMRMLRLLRGHDATLHHSLRGVVSQCAHAGYGFNWLGAALLVLFDGTAGHTRACRSIARDYYRAHAAMAERGTT